MKNPCKRDCEKRSAECHSECEEYIKYEEEYMSKKRVYKQTEESKVNDYIKNSIRRNKEK